MSTVDDRHVITPAGRTEETLAWLEGRGYRAGLVSPSYEAAEYSMSGSPPGPFMGGMKLVGKAGVVFGKKNEPVIIAQIGDVLVYDGDTVSIEE